jgi:hypothetical protein
VVVEGNSKNKLLLQNNGRVVKLGDRQIIYLKDEDEAIELVKTALKKGLKAETAPITLEDVFVKLVGGEEA